MEDKGGNIFGRCCCPNVVLTLPKMFFFNILKPLYTKNVAKMGNPQRHSRTDFSLPNLQSEPKDEHLPFLSQTPLSHSIPLSHQPTTRPLPHWSRLESFRKKPLRFGTQSLNRCPRAAMMSKMWLTPRTQHQFKRREVCVSILWDAGICKLSGRFWASF